MKVQRRCRGVSGGCYEGGFCEALESRTYFDLTPAIVGAIPSSLIATLPNKGTVTVNLTNTGGTSIKGAYTVNLLASPDGQVGDATPILTKNETLATLGAGATRALKISLGVLPAITNGSYLLVAEITGPLAGVGDNAGVSAGRVDIANPFVDLTNTVAINARSSVKPGAKFPITVTVTNHGNITAKGSTMLRIATSLSSDGSSPQTRAVLNSKINIAPGKQATFHIMPVVPDHIAPGAYFFVTTVDPANTLLESDATNNGAVSPTALTVISPYVDITGVDAGPFSDTKGPSKGGTGTITLDVVTEDNTSGVLSGTGSNSAGSNFTFVGTISTTGVVVVHTTNPTTLATSVLTGKVVRGKIVGTFLVSNGNGGTFSLTI